MDGIDWVDDEPDPGVHDEILPGQDHQPMRGRTRSLIAAGVTLVVGAAIAAAVVRNSGGDTAPHPQAARTTPAPTTPTGSRPGSAGTPTPEQPAPAPSFVLRSDVPASEIVVVPISPCQELSGDGLTCTVQILIPEPAAKAMRSVLPDARIDGTTILGRGNKLYTRHIRAKVADRTLIVDIAESAAVLPSYDTILTPGQERVAIAVTTRGLHVLLTYTGPRDKVPSTSQLDRLGADARLLTDIS